MKKVFVYPLIAFLSMMVLPVADAQQEIVVIDNGVPNEELINIVGEPWDQGDGYLEKQGTGNFLWSNAIVGPGDFHVTVNLTIFDLVDSETGRGSAASFQINDMLNEGGQFGSNFGFAGGDGQLFAEGTFFGPFQDMGPTPIQEGEPFQFEFIREGDTYRFLINGEEWLTAPLPDEEPGSVFRGGFYQVALRPHRSRMQVSQLTIVTQTGVPSPIEEKRVFVEDGVPQDVVEVGGIPWEWDENTPYNAFDTGVFSFGNMVLAGEQFHIKARLTIADLDGSAASFTLNGDNHFGFAGGSNQMFIQGDLFGSSQSLGPTVVEDNVPFDFDMIRNGDELFFMINGKEVGRTTFLGGDIFGFAGFRPWRSWMFVHEFSVEPVTEATAWPEVERSLPTGAFYTAGQAIPGVQLTAEIPEGETVNAKVVETAPEGWSLTNINVANGDVTQDGNQITWQMDNASGKVELTYDLTAPDDATDFEVEFNGEIQIPPFSRLVTGTDSLFLKAGIGQINVVEDGVASDYVLQVGDPWTEGDGYLENTARDNYLYANIAIVDVEYHITAHLTLFGMGGTASSIAIQGIPDGSNSNLGFEGGSNQFFIEGNFFGGSQSLGETTLQEATPFVFEMINDDGEISFLIDGETLHTMPYDPEKAFRVGLRPWRSRMQVTDFVIDVTETTAVVDWSLY